MFEHDDLEAGVWLAEHELARTLSWHDLGGVAPDPDVIAALRKALDEKLAERALRAAATTPKSPSSQPDAPRPPPSVLMGARTTGLEATVIRRMDRLATSMAHLYALRPTPLVTVRVENKGDGIRRVAVRCRIEGYSAEVVASRELDSAGTAAAVAAFDLFPPLFPQRIRRLRELTAASLHVEVVDLDGPKVEITMAQPIALLPPTTAVLGYTDPATGKVTDDRELLAAWVTPNAIEVLELLRTAVDISTLKQMIGYQGTAAEVREHVRAIYTALASAKIAYVDSRIAFGAGSGFTCQRVRLPRESLATRSANCIDGTVLMASLLEATGIDPFIVIIPGHAYLGYRPWRDAPVEELVYVETTVIASKSFDEAVVIATDRTTARKALNQVLPLDVRALRAKGITPME